MPGVVQVSDLPSMLKSISSAQELIVPQAQKSSSLLYGWQEQSTEIIGEAVVGEMDEVTFEVEL